MCKFIQKRAILSRDLIPTQLFHPVRKGRGINHLKFPRPFLHCSKNPSLSWLTVGRESLWVICTSCKVSKSNTATVRDVSTQIECVQGHGPGNCTTNSTSRIESLGNKYSKAHGQSAQEAGASLRLEEMSLSCFVVGANACRVAITPARWWCIHLFLRLRQTFTRIHEATRNSREWSQTGTHCCHRVTQMRF